MKTKKIKYILALILSGVSIVGVLCKISDSCSNFNSTIKMVIAEKRIKGSGTIVSKNLTSEISLNDITGIEIATPVHLQLHQVESDSDMKIELEAEENIIDFIKVEKIGNNLKFFLQLQGNVAIESTKKISLHVHLKKINRLVTLVHCASTVECSDITTDSLDIQCSGSGIVSIGNIAASSRVNINSQSSRHIFIKNISAPHVSIDTSGSSSLKAHLETKELQVQTVRSSTIYLSGKANKQNISCAGSSQYNAEALENAVTQIYTANASKAKIKCTDEVSGECSGSSSIIISGNPKITVHKKGGATVSSA